MHHTQTVMHYDQMKKTITIIILVCSLNLFSQSNQISGEYFRELGNEKHLIQYRLNLNQNGTFTFHSYTEIELPPQKVNKYGKGTWKSEGKIISFQTDKDNDIDNLHSLDFDGSKARFISKSPRDKSNRIVKKSLQFFESKIFWVERLQISKK